MSFGSILPGVVGIDRGFYRDEGIDLQTPVMAAGPGTTALIAGEVDYSAGGNAIRAAMQGAPLKAVLFYFNSVIFEMVVGQDVKTAADLKGKRIGHNGIGSSTDQVARILIRNAGLDPANDVTFVTSPAGQEVTTLVAGAVDAIMMNPDAAAKATAQGKHVLIPTREVGRQIPSPQGGWAVTDAALRSKPDLIKRWMRGTITSLQFIREHQPETVAIAAKAFQMEPDVAKEALTAVVEAIDPDNFGGFSDAGIKLEIANDLDAVKGQASVTGVDQLTDLTLLHQAQKDLGVPCKGGYGC
jgi:NitT/TauT family transport system substrate-binding protein